jgi:hypothetical protein
VRFWQVIRQSFSNILVRAHAMIELIIGPAWPFYSNKLAQSAWCLSSSLERSCMNHSGLPSRLWFTCP